MKQFTLKELVKRKLDETYIIIYAIKNEVNIKKAEIIEKTDVYTFVGVDIKGNRQFINSIVEFINNSAKFIIFFF